MTLSNIRALAYQALDKNTQAWVYVPALETPLNSKSGILGAGQFINHRLQSCCLV